MGAVTQEYAASSNLTVTALNGGIASSNTLLAGWTSETVDNTSTKYEDILVTGKITVESSGLTAGVIEVWAYAMLDDSNWPDVFSSGTEGTEGTATISDSEQKAASFRLLWSCATDTGASEVYSMAPSSVAGAFGGVLPPKFAIFITHSTVAALETSGNQVTIKGVYRSVA